MNKLLDQFFEELTVWEDTRNGSNHKCALQKATAAFLTEPNFETAQRVFEAFFKAYWMGIQDEGFNPFVELVHKVHQFEHSAGSLLKKHRDHYVHSVHVFLLGIAIFRGSDRFRILFERRSTYPDAYSTQHEEFLFRWGIASLLHDIAYPLEISIKQVTRYLQFIDGYPVAVAAPQVRATLTLPSLDNVPLYFLVPSEEAASEYTQAYPRLTSEGRGDSVSLLAYALHNSFGIAVEDVRSHLVKHVENMRNDGFIDHGYYSSAIVLKWYHHLYRRTAWNPAYFYFPVVDAASAILLHNYYQHVLMKEPFRLGKLAPEKHPLAFLLMLCDELQDWNRGSLGETSDQVFPARFEIDCSPAKLSVSYQFEQGEDIHDFAIEKLKRVQSLLLLDSLFSDGIEVR